MPDAEKLTQKAENVAPALIDLFYIVDMGGAPESEKITYSNIINSGLQTITGTLVAGNATDIVDAATTGAAGISELATAAEVSTGTDAVRTITPNALAGSDYGKRIVSIGVNDQAALTSGDGKAYFLRIPSELNGWNIIKVAANIVAGTAEVEIQIHNLTQAADILSTPLTIDANEKDSKDAAVPAVIDTNEDDVQTGDRLRIDIDDEGVGTTWLDVQITLQLP